MMLRTAMVTEPILPVSHIFYMSFVLMRVLQRIFTSLHSNGKNLEREDEQTDPQKMFYFENLYLQKFFGAKTK